MRYDAVAMDFDGTLATEGVVADGALQALRRLLDSGRRLILITGRELGELKGVFPHLELFERVVAENGALLYRPASGEVRLLGEPAAPELARALRERGATPLSVAQVIVATREPYGADVQEVIDNLGLPLDVVLNKGAVMVMPRGVDKRTGLMAAAAEMDLQESSVVGVGDAENDIGFLAACGCSVAVANALPAVAACCDYVTEGEDGAGIAELASKIIEDDLAFLDATISIRRSGAQPL